MGMQGMGSSGAGMGGMGSLPPGLLQMLLAQAQGGVGGGMTPGAAMMGPQINASAARPMGSNMSPMMPPQGPPQQAPGQLSGMMQPGANGAPSPLMAMLAALKGAQQGVTPQPGLTPGQSAGANPQLASMPQWLQSLLLGTGHPGTNLAGAMPSGGPGGIG
jgi:hypothetical protein